jgi:hypothetical protein
MTRSDKRANSHDRQIHRLAHFGHGSPKQPDQSSPIKRLRYDRSQNQEELPDETRVFQ